MFTTSPTRYDQNALHSQTITASPAFIRNDEGDHIPGVALFTRGKVAIVVTTDAAQRVALEIVEALEKHKTTKPVKRATSTNDAFADLADR
ncbi:hypothetical protein [Kocuria kalidii]|uniref:hypothetical protein n=1 Tax=Kocuria kalidii TaxID=3376283 RepID=UPI0037A7328C